jgi:hypothetical protein
LKIGSELRFHGIDMRRKSDFAFLLGGIYRGISYLDQRIDLGAYRTMRHDANAG